MLRSPIQLIQVTKDATNTVIEAEHARSVIHCFAVWVSTFTRFPSNPFTIRVPFFFRFGFNKGAPN